MDQRSTLLREVALPSVTLSAIRQALEGSVESSTIDDALRKAGNAAGREFFLRFDSSLAGPDSRTVPADRFWAQLGEFFRRGGWGEVRHEPLHPAAGLLRSGDWAEADSNGDASGGAPGCRFTEGVLAGLLSELAGQPLYVMETQCRGQGDPACEFVYGPEAVVRKIGRRLRDGEALDTILEDL